MKKKSTYGTICFHRIVYFKKVNYRSYHMLKKMCNIDKPNANEMYHLNTNEGEEKKVDGHLCTISHLNAVRV